MSKFLVVAILCVLVCAGALLLINSPSTAAKDVDPAAATKILSIPACAFNEIKWGSDWNAHREGALLYSVPNGPSFSEFGMFYAPVQLPQNARVRKMILFYKTNDTPGMTIYLKRSLLVNNGTPTETTLATIGASTLSPNWKKLTTTSISPNKINNTNACYYIHAYLSDVEAMDVLLHHVEIHYTGNW